MTLLDQLDNIRNFYFTIFLETKTKIVTLHTFQKNFSFMEIMDNPQFFWCPTTETVRTDLLIIPPNKISILAILEKEAKDDKVQIFLFQEKTVQFFWN